MEEPKYIWVVGCNDHSLSNQYYSTPQKAFDFLKKEFEDHEEDYDEDLHDDEDDDEDDEGVEDTEDE